MNSINELMVLWFILVKKEFTGNSNALELWYKSTNKTIPITWSYVIIVLKKNTLILYAKRI